MDANMVLVGKLDRKKPLGRLRRRWENNIKINLGGIGQGYGLDSSGSG
jgi:thiamine biosynthesis lipoprotein ApbE